MDKEQAAISRLREASQMSLMVYQQPLIVTTSGGKDSSVCVALAERAGILRYSITIQRQTHRKRYISSGKSSAVWKPKG